MNIFKRIKWVIAILCVFLVILATNLMDHKNFQRVEKSVDDIYNQRLVAKELLLNVSIKFHEKEMAYALNDSIYLHSKNDRVNSDITKSLGMFERSVATNKEEYIIENLNSNHLKLIQLEKKSLAEDTLYSSECSGIFSKIKTNINELANEQMMEGEYQKRLAVDAINSVKMFSKIEIYTLVFLALLLMVIVLYNPNVTSEES